jgi:PAS domain S-box-containing protein
LLQVAFLGAYFVLADRNKLSIERAELVLLLSYSAVAIGLAMVVGFLRKRWILREDSVRQRLLGVIEAIPDPSAVRNVKGRCVMWNKAAEEYHGVRSQHVVDKTPFELFPPAVARSILELDAQCSLGGQPLVQRLVLPPLYGKGQRAAMIRIAPLRSATDASIRGVVTILHDVTEAEREANALRHLSMQLKLALDTSGFGSWIWDLEGDVAVFSAQLQALLRHKGETFRQDFEFISRIHPGDVDMVKTATIRTLKEYVPFDQVFRMRCFDEVYRYFDASGELALDDKGKHFFAGLLCPLDRSAD